MKYFPLWILISLLFLQCTADVPIHTLDDSELITLQVFQQLSNAHSTSISDANEPGERLLLCLTFVSKTSNRPLRNQEVFLYHTSAEGEYEPIDPDDETTARLNGSATTNEAGQIFVQTILPGDYGSSENNRHIHMTVFGAKPEFYDIHFLQFSGGMGRRFIEGSDQHFLADLKMNADSTLVTFLTVEVKNPELKSELAEQPLPSCEWCGAYEAPQNISWQDTIADDNVKGERLILEGTIFRPDGKTQAENIIVYAYHTNEEGLYEKKGDETGNGRRHGYLRGWVKTNEKGQYRFYTIKPAPYPSHVEPAHIHMTLKGEDFDEYWINSTWFEGDRIITEEMTSNLDRTGGFSNIIALEKDTAGTWVGKRDIIIAPPEN